MADLVYPPVIGVIKAFWRYLGIQLHSSGDTNIPHKGGAILAINHVSYLDFALVGTAALPVDRYIRFMAKKEIFAHKVAGPLMRGMHHISVDRENGSGSFVAALRALKAGEIIGIFPEGTTSTSFEIKELKNFLKVAGVPVRAYSLEEVEALPFGTNFIWNGERSMFKTR